MIEDFAQQLELFTARFKNRIVEMVSIEKTSFKSVQETMSNNSTS